MAKTAINLGLLLTVIGLVGYFGVSSESITALIPAFIGIPVALLGLIGLNQKRLKTTMHIAVILMLIGLVGSLWRALPTLFSGEIVNQTALIFQLATAVVCLIFLVLAIKSFIDARKPPEIL